MGSYLHRTDKIYLKSISPDELPEPLVNYISNPDMSAVGGVPSRYWVVIDDSVEEMGLAEKNIVDAALLNAVRDKAVNAAVDDLEGNLRQLVRLIIRELNILRTEHGLPDRTMAQFKSQIRNGYGS